VQPGAVNFRNVTSGGLLNLGMKLVITTKINYGVDTRRKKKKRTSKKRGWNVYEQPWKQDI
jgi:hypothetical protein